MPEGGPPSRQCHGVVPLDHESRQIQLDYGHTVLEHGVGLLGASILDDCPPASVGTGELHVLLAEHRVDLQGPTKPPSGSVYLKWERLTPFMRTFITTDPLASRISAARFSPATGEHWLGEGFVSEDRQIALQQRRTLRVVPLPAGFAAVDSVTHDLSSSDVALRKFAAGSPEHGSEEITLRGWSTSTCVFGPTAPGTSQDRSVNGLQMSPITPAYQPDVEARNPQRRRELILEVNHRGWGPRLAPADPR